MSRMQFKKPSPLAAIRAERQRRAAFDRLMKECRRVQEINEGLQSLMRQPFRPDGFPSHHAIQQAAYELFRP